MLDTIQNGISEEVKVTHLPQDDHKQYQLKKGIPSARKLLREESGWCHETGSLIPDNILKLGQDTLERYLGYKPQTFAEYVAANAP